MADPALLLPNQNPPAEDPAVSLIRGKLAELFEAEPKATDEVKEIESVGASSKHQKFLQQLMSSGKEIAEIQTAWHEYYQGLTQNEKREVWQEFYSNQSRQSHMFETAAATAKQTLSAEETKKPITKQGTKPQSVSDIKKKLANKVSANGRLTKKHHLKSLLFGLGMAGVVALLVVFTLFNQLFITPFISPSKAASATPLIVDPSGQTAVGAETKIIIPKLNVDAPIVMDAADNSEAAIQSALERGVTLYPNTGKPGELSNPIIFGHSSNNIFNHGDYKFVFVLLSRLEEGDTIMVNYNSKQYVYKVFNKKVVKPEEVAVLSEKPKPAMITLITCDPPGSSANRLIVHAEQISPDPNANIASSASDSSETPNILPSNPESLFQRILDWF